MSFIFFMKPKLYIIAYAISIAIMGSYVINIFYSIWFGSINILIPVIISLICGFAIAVGYPLCEFIISIRNRDGTRIVFSGIASIFISSLIFAFHAAITNLIFTPKVEYLIDLTHMSYESKLFATAGLILIIVFFILSILHFILSAGLISFFEALGELFKKKPSEQ